MSTTFDERPSPASRPERPTDAGNWPWLRSQPSPASTPHRSDSHSWLLEYLAIEYLPIRSLISDPARPKIIQDASTPIPVSVPVARLELG